MSIWVVGSLLGLGAIATRLGFASPFWWGFSYFDYPRPQYCLILAIGIAMGVFSRQQWPIKRWYLLGLIPLLINSVLLVPYLISFEFQNDALSADSHQLRLVHITFDHDYPDPQPLIQFLESQDVDVVSILEVTPDSLRDFQTGLTHYQLAAAEPRTNSHGSAWFVSQRSRGLNVITSAVMHLPPESDRPLLTLTLSVAGDFIQLVCFHSIRPQNAGSFAYQAKEFEALANWSQQQIQLGHKFILIGDFNTTPWATRFRQTLQINGLANSQRGFGLQPTWPAVLPDFLRLPIDHCLLSPEFKPLQRRVGAKIGSDHLPLFVEVGWNRAN